MWWVPTIFSVRCKLSPWQTTTIVLLVCPTGTVMLDDVMYPPLAAGVTTEVFKVFRTCFEETVHLISAGGLLLSVVQVTLTFSPALASVAPSIVTWVGATVNYVNDLDMRTPFSRQERWITKSLTYKTHPKWPQLSAVLGSSRLMPRTYTWLCCRWCLQWTCIYFPMFDRLSGKSCGFVHHSCTIWAEQEGYHRETCRQVPRSALVVLSPFLCTLRCKEGLADLEN